MIKFYIVDSSIINFYPFLFISIHVYPFLSISIHSISMYAIGIFAKSGWVWFIRESLCKAQPAQRSVSWLSRWNLNQQSGIGAPAARLFCLMGCEQLGYRLLIHNHMTILNIVFDTYSYCMLLQLQIGKSMKGQIQILGYCNSATWWIVAYFHFQLWLRKCAAYLTDCRYARRALLLAVGNSVCGSSRCFLQQREERERDETAIRSVQKVAA